jgi:redox-sensitive bicupin YhaK (pirin superfamily)
VVTQDLQHRLDPWLMLDEFGSDKADDYLAGFPPHPHRGFETITYMLAGRMEHQDNRGNRGVVEAGGVQWMRAGKGIIHSEMPAQEAGLMRGFQFWLNLPRAHKMSEPDWADISADLIPVYQGLGYSVKVIAGEYEGLTGVIQREDTKPLILDVVVEQTQTLGFTIEDDHHSYLYGYEGKLEVGQQVLNAPEMGILSLQGNYLSLVAHSGTRMLLVSGKPLNEPIVSGGPFVMNSEAEIKQAFSDYRSGRF